MVIKSEKVENSQKKIEAINMKKSLTQESPKRGIKNKTGFKILPIDSKYSMKIQKKNMVQKDLEIEEKIKNEDGKDTIFPVKLNYRPVRQIL